jgi:hypothetical protein
MSAAYREAAKPERKLVLDLKFPNDRHVLIQTELDKVVLSIVTDTDTGQRVDTHATVPPSDAMKIAGALCYAAAEVARG